MTTANARSVVDDGQPSVVTSTSIPITVRLLTVALLGGGIVGLITAGLLMRGAWPWPMPDLAYRFLAGAATAYAIASAITLLRSTWAESELLLVTVILYGIPLGLAILIEPDPVDWGDIVAWSFLGLVISALAVSLWAVWTFRGRATRNARARLSPPMRAVLLVLGGLSVAVGTIVYAVPRDSGFVWPWAELGPWKPLDTRLLASMLIAIGGGALLVAWRNVRGTCDVFLPMLWGYCVITSIGLAIHARKTPAFRTEDYVYIIIFAVVLAVTLGLFLVDRRDSSRSR